MISKRISAVIMTALGTTVRKNSAFTIGNYVSRIQVSSKTNPYASKSPFSSTKSKALYDAVPEAGPCPECNDANGYWDGSTNFVCIACGNEWLVDAQNEGTNEDDATVRDSNGNILESGDTVVLTKELGKGLKKGLKILRIRVGDYGDDHDVQANIPGLGTFNLKSQFLKKTK
jgi:protein PhnA